ncbi:MAG TPA: hypothetical protein VI139_06960 [Gemmatimonadales bacterium]
MSPNVTMPHGPDRVRQAAIAELNNALCAARCAAQLAGMESQQFGVKELLLTTLSQIDRAAVIARRLL